MDGIFIDIQSALIDLRRRINRGLMTKKRIIAVEICEYVICDILEVFEVEQLFIFLILISLRFRRRFECMLGVLV